MKVLSKSKLLKVPVEKKVSIIITNFKKEKFLKKAVLSCINQSYSNLEIIILDDNSNKDFCKKLLKSFKDNRIKLFYTTKNYGHYACTNYALDRCTGDYVTFLGADDYIEKDHVKNLITAVVSHNLLAVCCTYSRLRPDGSYVKRNALCEASIFFDRKTFLRDIGYYHMVRCAADTEYRERAIAFYGSSKIGFLKECSYKALWSPNSLTSAPNTKSRSALRANYVKIFRKNHKILLNIRFDYKKQFKEFNIGKDFDVEGFDPSTFRKEAL